jgi:phosphoenolpyruvate carboxykinase (ATP)
MADADARCILLNTGWSGGPYGKGHRISIQHTRALLDAALAGDLDDVETIEHPTLGLRMPLSCPGVPNEVLNPRETWEDPDGYDEAAERLRGMFRENYETKGFSELGITAKM